MTRTKDTFLVKAVRKLVSNSSKLVSFNGLTFVVALIALVVALYGEHKQRADLLVLPRCVAINNAFQILSDINYGRPEEYFPGVHASFRFLNRSRQPVTITGYSVRLRLRGIGGERDGPRLDYLSPQIEFIIPPGESTVRAVESYVGPTLTYSEAKRLEALIRHWPTGGSHGVYDLFSQLSFTFFTDLGETYVSQPYEADPRLWKRSGSGDKTGMIEACFTKDEKQQHCLEQMREDTKRQKLILLPSRPLFPTPVTVTNQAGAVRHGYSTDTGSRRILVPTRRFFIDSHDHP